ncbi:MAG: DNA methyltransferase [Nitriliruptor sp.]|uniref:DNA methyltransferase n=1 Tax=Nitriliruptor sp. TaxID=2448056 RepID=UPI0034A06507
MRSGEEIQRALRGFVARWSGYRGTERGEAQTYLNELIACFGVDRLERAELEDARGSQAGVMDFHWPGVVIIEMKAPAEADRLERHRDQALGYWRASDDAAAGRPAPPFVVLCAFHRFEVWQPGLYPSSPVAEFTLEELPDRYETLLFLGGSGDDPIFGIEHRELTTQAATHVSQLYHALLDRSAARPEVIQTFVLQAVWCLFAEDLRMLQGYPFQRTVETLLAHPERSSYADLGALFAVLNDEDDGGRHGLLAGTTYVNGELFAEPARLHLEVDELELLRQAAAFDWDKVDPTIFGSLLEGFLGENLRSHLGAHYTHEVDIKRIVDPTIVDPLREQLDRAASITEVERVLRTICEFRVLDPACGCGNFLYVAYRELRALEAAAKAKIAATSHAAGVPAPDPTTLPFVTLRNFHGLEIEPVAASIARVTLWMGHRQMLDAYGPAEPPLPLVDLSNIQGGVDALVHPWPSVDAIIGNPPFLGSQNLRRGRGDAYLDWLKEEFGVGIKDYCVYWFRRAHAELRPGQRAGLVGTNSISQNRARSASLEHITATGGVITEAVSTQKWPGEAKVHVSIVNWIKDPPTPPTRFVLDGAQVTGITAELVTPERSTASAVRLEANRGRCFQGPIPVGDGFILTTAEAEELLARDDASYRDVVRPYLTGEDIADDPEQRPGRWIIDFAQRPLEEAMRYPAALAIVRERVKPDRDTNRRKARRERWWLFGEQAVGLRRATADLPRYIGSLAFGKRLLLTWLEPWTCPSGKIYVFAFDGDDAMGLLNSRAHDAWAWARGSTLKADLSYTSTSAFETFPWPELDDEHRATVASAGAALYERRTTLCRSEGIGSTELYNRLDDGAYTDLRDAHRALDRAVAAAYGWPLSVAQDDDELVRRLLIRNREIADGAPYDPFPRRTGTSTALQLDV